MLADECLQSPTADWYGRRGFAALVPASARVTSRLRRARRVVPPARCGAALDVAGGGHGPGALPPSTSWRNAHPAAAPAAPVDAGAIYIESPEPPPALSRGGPAAAAAALMKPTYRDRPRQALFRAALHKAVPDIPFMASERPSLEGTFAAANNQEPNAADPRRRPTERAQISLPQIRAAEGQHRDAIAAPRTNAPRPREWTACA